MLKNIFQPWYKKAQHRIPAFDELILLTLKRYYLGVKKLDFRNQADDNNDDFQLSDNVRLLKIDEISFDIDEKIHLPGVESSLTAMKNRGYSLVFLVQGNSTGAAVYLGVSKFSADDKESISDVLDGYKAVWESNFSGSKFSEVDAKDVKSISMQISKYENIGVLTGIPSLKREEEKEIFVQGLERLIRAMRGKTYTWLTIADPISEATINQSISNCRRLQSDIHHLVKSEISHSKSTGKTVMLGVMGMMGQGETSGKTDGTNYSDVVGENSSHTDSRGQTEGFSANFAPSVMGWSLGGVGVNSTKSTTLANTIGTMKSFAKGVCNSITNTVSNQFGGGAVGTFGLTFTQTTTVGMETLNRKAEYTEELLKRYEERLLEGVALGMWNMGHYFCAQNPSDYNLGIGVVTSLCAGMQSSYEPPNAVTLDSKANKIIRRFQNVLLRIPEYPANSDQTFVDHPLGIIFNGPTTPVSTPELAIATPFAVQDVEGVTVTRRVPFGLNIPQIRNQQETVSIGNILDKGNETKQMYRLALNNIPKHLSIFGLTGSGKTNTVHQLLIQLWRNYKTPFMVIEPAKAEYRALADSTELKDDLLVISAGIDRTEASPLRINPFYFDPGKDNDANRVHLLTHIDRLKAVFNASFPMYGPMPYILEEAIHKVYKDRGWDLGRSCNRYVDIYKDDFSEYVPTLHDLYLTVDKIVDAKHYFKEQEMNIKAALKARLSSLMIGAKGSMFNTLNSVPAEELFTRPVVIELEHLGDDDEKAFLMGLLVSKLYEYRKATFQSSDDVSGQPDHVLVIEEAHRLLANIPDTSANMESANVKGKSVAAFVDMLAEIRAMRQGVFIVDQLPSRVSPAVIKGTGSKIIHRLLATDDRESVGGTMGLNDDQIRDLALLQTGQCVVNQDGDRQSYMCQVGKCDLHEKRKGGEVSFATTRFKEQYQSLFHFVSDDIDMEDWAFRDNLFKIMLAIGCDTNCTTGLLDDVLKKDARISGDWFKYYWKNICNGIMAFYKGDYQRQIALASAGEKLFTDGDSALADYRAVFREYFIKTKKFIYSGSDSLPPVAYAQLISRFKILENINTQFDKFNGIENPNLRLKRSIEKLLPILCPDGLKCQTLEKEIAKAIIFKISPNLSFELVMEA